MSARWKNGNPSCRDYTRKGRVVDDGAVGHVSLAEEDVAAVALVQRRWRPSTELHGCVSMYLCIYVWEGSEIGQAEKWINIERGAKGCVCVCVCVCVAIVSCTHRARPCDQVPS